MCTCGSTRSSGVRLNDRQAWTPKQQGKFKKFFRRFFNKNPQIEHKIDAYKLGLKMYVQSEMQSSGITSSEVNNSAPDRQIAEVVQFLDENVGEDVGHRSMETEYQRSDAYDVNSSLGEFLSRPVRIGSFTWLESDAIGLKTTLEPWHLFFNDARIKYKLNNYSFIRCNLKVKILINASPFYYGAQMATYQPLTKFNPTTIYNDAGVKDLIPHSQRPHVWLYPQNNEGGEMTLPFFYHKDWLRISYINDFKDMGLLSFYNYTALESANGATGTGCTVQVYAWAEDVVVSGPTLGLALTQSTMQDSYKVSSIASAVSNAASALGNVPVIGTMARAANIGASGVAKAAKILGFSNPPNIKEIHAFKPVTNCPLASSEISFPVEKLTLDPKNELTLDPKVVGLGSEDELSMDYLKQRESYLTAATWSTTNAVDDILFYSAVAPQFAYDVTTIPTSGLNPSNAYYQTPVAWLSKMFQHWRGDVIYRFRIVASQYHKGRLRISFDPTGYAGQNIISDNVSTSVIYNTIVDLGKDSNVELRIPYNQALPWLSTDGGVDLGATTNTKWSTSLTPTFAYDDKTSNGNITVRCLTTLTAPVTSSSIKILVSVRGAENLEFANPCNTFGSIGGMFTGGATTARFSLLTPQSSMTSYDKSGETKMTVAGSLGSTPQNRYLANFGEAITSLRQVLRRSTYAGSENFWYDTPGSIYVTAVSQGRLPLTYGYDVEGNDSAKKQDGITDMKFVNSPIHPITYVSTAFVGTRGSVNWTITSGSSNSLITIERLPSSYAYTSYSRAWTTLNATNNSVSNRNLFLFSGQVPGGGSLIGTKTQPHATISLPMYSGVLMQSTNAKFLTSSATKIMGSTIDDEYQHGYMGINTTYDGGTPSNRFMWHNKYAGIGMDFSCFCFLNVPTMYYLYSSPTAV